MASRDPGLMMARYELDGIEARLAAGVWMADAATVIGDVGFAEDSSVWFGAVLGGDGEPICIQAAVLGGVVLGPNSIVGADALATADAGFPEGSPMPGAPATEAHQPTAQQIARIGMGAAHDVRNTARYRHGPKRVGGGA